jgi:homoserine O-acetyltransferase
MSAGWIDRPHQVASIGDLPLETGTVIRDCRLVWVEHGQRDRTGRNSVLICTAIGSTHHRLDFLIGPGRPLDPERLHIIAIDALGNGLSTSPSNSPHQQGADFPHISIRDMVESQHKLLSLLGIERLHTVIGASMGGMQALQWGVSHASQVERVVAMTPMAKTARWSQLVNEMARRALFEDAACTVPRDRADAMRLWVPLTQLAVPTTPAATDAFADQLALNEWLETRQEWFTWHGPDPFDWLCQTRAYDAHDLGSTPGFSGDTAAALRSVRAATLVLAPSLDLYNPAAAARAVAAAVPGATFLEIPSKLGHRAASGADPEDVLFLNQVIGQFISRQAE